jgi:hypothetical protein
MPWVKVGIICLLLPVVGLFSYALSHKRVNSFPKPLTSPNSDIESSSSAWTLYDGDPNHLWNRLYRALYQRVTTDDKEYGYDELDPLLWWQTKYLLTNPANRQAVTVLDEFLSTHGERAINDPLKRAILQRDLWAIFDWTTQSQNSSPEKLNLQNKLARVIKRLALSPQEIARLPNSYQRAAESKTFAAAYDLNKRVESFLPPDLFDSKGPWVMLSARGSSPIALGHLEFFSGRSVFLIFMRLPEGQEATLNYLKRVSDFPKPWLPDPVNPGRVVPNPELPEFPAGTQLALVREIVLIDNQGNLQSTKIIEDLQIRVHREIPNDIPGALNTSRNEARKALDVFEFKLSRPKLFADEGGGLSAVVAGEKEFALFRSHGIDFEQRESLQACASCHFQPGVHSMLSRGRMEPGGMERVQLIPAWDLNYEANETKGWKGRQHNWRLLQGLWRSQPEASN